MGWEDGDGGFGGLALQLGASIAQQTEGLQD